MDDLDFLLIALQKFDRTMNECEYLTVHADNKFNKQFSEVLRDWNYIRIISTRLSQADSEKITPLALDLKSLYVFGRVFSESVLYMTSLFFPDSKDVNWTKIGKFVVSMEKNVSQQPQDLKHFWAEVGGSIKILNKGFRYRNSVLHDKESMTEWTSAWPGRSNLDHVFISRVPWPGDEENDESSSFNAKSLLQILANEVPKILEYLSMTAIK